MEKQELEVHRRCGIGKGAARKLRAKGFFPGICYRKGIDPIPLSLDKRRMEKILQSSGGQSLLLQLRIVDDDGQQRQELVILKEVQRNPLAEIQHVDFLAVRMDEMIVVESPIRVIGTPEEAIRQGGMVQQLRRSLEVECLPGNIPEYFEVDVSNLNVGDSVHVDQLRVPDGVRVLTPAKEALIVVSSAAAEEKVKVEEAAVEEGAEAAAENTEESGGKGSSKE